MNHAAETPDLTWSEVADAVWLAGVRGTVSRPTTSPVGPGLPEPPPESSEPPPSADVPPSPAHRIEAPGTLAEEAVGGSTFPLGLATRLPTASIARALRPLARRVPSHRRGVLDEEGVAVRAAETGMWLPVLRPADTRLLDAVLLVDNSSSMALWRETVAAFHTLLTRQGAFRDVRLARVDTDQERPSHYTTPRRATGHSLAGLVDPAGRRVIFVLTDGVGRAWRQDAVGHWLPRLGESGPLVVLNVLPHRLWRLGNLGTEQVRLAATSPATPNRRLSWRPVWPPDEVSGAELPVPVLELAGPWLSRWAGLLMATGRVTVELPALLAGARSTAPDRPVLAPLPAGDAVRRFHLTASAQAFRLTALLAAAPVTRETIAEVRRRMVPDADRSHVAEVLLSGLLRPVTGAGAVEYEFADGVRAELLSALRRVDTVRVTQLVARVVAPALSDAAEFAVTHALGTYARAAVVRDTAPLAAPEYHHDETDLVPPRGLPHAVRALFDGGDGGPVVVRGGSDVDRTRFAVEYARELGDDYELVWWLPAHEPAAVVAAYRELAVRHGVVARGAGGQASVLAASRRARRWLVIFDGAAEPEPLLRYLPEGGHVLVTSDDPEWSRHGEVVDLVTPDPWRVGEIDVRDAARTLLDLCAVLGPGTLTDEYFSALTTMSEVPEALRDGDGRRPVWDELTRAGLVLADPPRGFRVPAPVRAAVLARLGDEAADRLREIARCLLAEALADDSARAGELVSHIRATADAESDLSRRLVLAAVGGLVDAGDPDNAAALADTVAHQWIAAIGKHHPDTRAAMTRLGVARRVLGDRQEAVGLHRDDETAALHLVRSLRETGRTDAAVELCRTLPPGLATSAELAASLRLAEVLRGARIPDEVARLQKEVVGGLLARFGEWHPATLMAMTDLALTRCLRGENPGDAYLVEARLRMLRGPAHPYTLACGAVLAGERYHAGDHDAALSKDTALAWQCADAWGPDHPATLALRLNAAQDARAAGQPGDDVFADCMRVLGHDHPLTRLATMDVRAWHDPDPPAWWRGTWV
jgi:hypothetical protein